MADDILEYVRRAREQGWSVTRTASNHWRFIPKDSTKPIVITSRTPSDWRSIKNFEADLRRSGLMTTEEMEQKVVEAAGAKAPGEITATAVPKISQPQVDLKPRGELGRLILEQLRINPTHKMSLDLLMTVLAPKVRGLKRQMVSNAITGLKVKGLVMQLERGMYRLVQMAPTATAAIAAEAHARAAHAVGAQTGIKVIDDRLKTLDNALSALAAVEKTIRETRQDLHDLAEFRRKLKELV